MIEAGLQQGHTFVNIDCVPPPFRSAAARVPFRQVDVTDYAPLVEALRESEALINLSAIANPDGHLAHVIHNTNVVGSYNALLGAVEVGMTRICQASSVNAIGHKFSRRARYDYFPIDENHPTYNEDPYSLSKWICEAQADSIVRRYEDVSVVSLRFHWVVADRSDPEMVETYNKPEDAAKSLTAYTRLDAAVRACLLALTAPIQGHEVFFIVAPDTAVSGPSLALAQAHYPNVPVQGDLSGNRSFFDSNKAKRLLGWSHGP
ncbi:NAD-dependent epimerase/dehydratase family protein [Cyanobium sp. Morenito 9A2]|nr:NAD-dependent epimerase/dehydratase family protein [Cyanobium sp. Morenito 9A2]